MNKTEIISEIINLADKAERYDRLIEEQAKNPIVIATNCEVEPEKASIVDSMVMKTGKKKIVRDTVSSYWADVNVSYNDETGVTDVQSFENWCNRNVKDVPEYISKRDFVAYFNVELREMYEEKKEAALEKFKEDE